MNGLTEIVIENGYGNGDMNKEKTTEQLFVNIPDNHPNTESMANSHSITKKPKEKKQGRKTNTIKNSQITETPRRLCLYLHDGMVVHWWFVDALRYTTDNRPRKKSTKNNYPACGIARISSCSLAEKKWRK